MHASKPTTAPIIKSNKFGNFKCSMNRYEIDQINMVPYASVVGSLMCVHVQVRTYPDIVYVSRIFWQKSSLDIDHWNRVENVLQFCKVS